MRNLILLVLSLGMLAGCGGGGGSSSETVTSGGNTISDPILIDSNDITVRDKTFYRYRMAAEGCRLLIIPSSPLRSVYSYDSRYNRSLGDLRIDGNYLLTATESDRNIVIKLGTYQDTKVTLVNNCDGTDVPRIANDTNEEGIYSLRPIYETSTQYVSSSEQNRMVYVYDENFNIINSGQYFINTTERNKLNYFYSNAPFSTAFANDSVGL